MRTELTKIHKRLGTTFIYVTHDPGRGYDHGYENRRYEGRSHSAALTRLRTCTTIRATCSSAGFIGTPQMNFINAKLEKKGEDVYVNFAGNSLKLPNEKANNPDLKDYIGKEVIVGLRPECIHDEPMYLSSMADSVISCNVDVTELMGMKSSCTSQLTRSSRSPRAFRRGRPQEPATPSRSQSIFRDSISSIRTPKDA